MRIDLTKEEIYSILNTASSFLGSIFLAFSIKESNSGYFTDSNKIEYAIAGVNHHLFITGISLLIVGYIFQTMKDFHENTMIFPIFATSTALLALFINSIELILITGILVMCGFMFNTRRHK
ncbi:MAG: hypothetical protein KGI50_00170 [Patescibacteria group bacterium]|nr:hypothetical protein [Patescibacteria group bacterium]MDE2438223.1 hypothetical protein [Patescibacteria group bacterium]